MFGSGAVRQRPKKCRILPVRGMCPQAVERRSTSSRRRQRPAKPDQASGYRLPARLVTRRAGHRLRQRPRRSRRDLRREGGRRRAPARHERHAAGQLAASLVTRRDEDPVRRPAEGKFERVRGGRRGGAIRNLSGGFGQLPQWSPDGRKIAFVKCGRCPCPAPGEIYVMNADGSAQRNVTRSPKVDDSWPTWAPRPEPDR